MVSSRVRIVEELIKYVKRGFLPDTYYELYSRYVKGDANKWLPKIAMYKEAGKKNNVF